ncbi:MAG: T9SS type A sorting domain-containing protein [Bacteroidota bacterium]
MKKLNILLSIFIFSSIGFSQTIVDNTKQWNSVIYHLPSFTISSESIKFAGDTVIDFKTYKKVFRSTDQSEINWNAYGYIRETIDEKVYYRMDTSQQEYLLYDFGVEIGDTVLISSLTNYANSPLIRTLSFVFTSTDSIQIASVYRKQFHFSPLTLGQESDTWIEGIGSKNGMLHFDGLLVGGDSYELNCYFENNILIYHNPSYQNCYITPGISDVSQDENTFVWPNPVTEKSILKIKELKNEKALLEIFDSRGCLMRSELFSNQFEIIKSEFTSGIYLYRVSFYNELLGSGKIVIE